jgi:hypothetical protein
MDSHEEGMNGTTYWRKAGKDSHEEGMNVQYTRGRQAVTVMREA